MAGRVGDGPAPDQAMPAINPDVVFVAKGRDRQIDPLPAVRVMLGLGVFDRPARVAVLLAQLGRLIGPFRRNAALLDIALFAVGVALLRCGDDRGVDDLAAHRQVPGRRERRIEALETEPRPPAFLRCVPASIKLLNLRRENFQIMFGALRSGRLNCGRQQVRPDLPDGRIDAAPAHCYKA